MHKQPLRDDKVSEEFFVGAKVSLVPSDDHTSHAAVVAGAISNKRLQGCEATRKGLKTI